GERLAPDARWHSAPLEAGFAPLHEGLNAFLEILGGEDRLFDGWDGLDGCSLALLEVGQRGRLGRTQPEGRALANSSRDFHRPLAVLAVRMDLLHEPDPQRLLRVELVAEEQAVHRVAPAPTRPIPDTRTP